MNSKKCECEDCLKAEIERLKQLPKKILKEFLDSMEYEGCDFATRAAIKHIFAKHGITEVKSDS